jgi:raffinose/stachyose/melibiose transport system substrate-binding protein
MLLLSLAPAALATSGDLSGTITFWYTADESNPNDFSRVWHKKNIELFEQQYPNVKIEATVVADGNDYLTKISTEMAAGNAPDVFRTWLTGPAGALRHGGPRDAG